ncbi:Scarecrow-like protein [Actinidia chinensis var. chinensis]|uniref:Scarecrow-like protein n=1 Tax=Actinidia chinensis var. chinensis TaxID=1590841 RepID=A0A2R6R9A9_ACTCC|nr:Scarecrow-like protein [Actinidia chinensis var. chinensis]
MLLPLDFEGKGFFELLTESSNKESCFFLDITEPISVLDTISSPSPPTSTLSSSLGGGGGGSGSADTAGVAAVSGNSNVGVESGCGSSELRQVPPPPPEVGCGSAAAGAEKCGLGMEDWESILSDSAAASPGQEQSVLRWIMGDVEDPSMGLNRLLQSGGGGGPAAAEFEFHGGFGGGGVDQGFGFDPVASGGGNLMGPINSTLPIPGFSHTPNKFAHEKLNLAPNPSNPQNYKLPNPPNPMFSPLSNNFLPISLSQAAFNHPQPPLESPETKPHIFNPLMLINNHQAQPPQNPAFFLPFPYPQQDPHLILPPPAKRQNTGGLEPIQKGQFSDSMLQHQHQQDNLSHHLHLLPYLQQRPKMVGDEMGQNQGVIDQLFKVAELIQTGNSVHAHGILARLNHQLSPIGKPFHRAAFFFKEALQVILHPASLHSSPFNLILKIGAYKSFSEISPLLQFANFTCNQALLEIVDGFDRIHIVDFDIGYGGQWASLMQELALRSGGALALKITAFASPSTHDQLELGLTRENLMHFAAEINVPFEFEIVGLDSLHSLPLHENEAVAVNLPVGSFSNHQLPLPLILRFVKQLSPKIVVSVDRGCDRNDLPFPNHVIHALQSYTNLLESLDAVNVNLEALQKIERFLIQPGIEKIVMGRYRSPEKTPHWRTLFLSSGFSPLTFSNFAESQADCVVKRTPVRGFHIEKRQSSLVLCWQRKELISASAWRC